MKNINQYILLMVATVALLFTACDEDDNTGYSSIVPSTPTLSVDVSAGPVSLVEKKSTYLFDVTLSEAQVTDISLYISVVEGGTATIDSDFTIDNGGKRVYIRAGKTSGTVSITVLEDELLEETETFTIQIGDEKTANATIVPVTVDFTLANLTADDLFVGLSWETNVKDLIGIEMDAVEVVDLRFLIIDAAGVVDTIVDGASFENYTFLAADLADGEYTLAVDIASAAGFGDISQTLSLDLDLQFDQVGTINAEILDFDAVMTNEFVCELFRVELATVTKVGNSYSFEKNVVLPSDPLAGTWSGTDATDYESQVETKVGCGLVISGLLKGWMEDYWGEPVIDEGTVVITIDEEAGTIDIAEQYLYTTTWKGEVQTPYDIKGTGTIDMSGDSPVMVINYEIIQGGWSVSEYMFGEGGTFTATLTLD